MHGAESKGNQAQASKIPFPAESQGRAPFLQHVVTTWSEMFPGEARLNLQVQGF